VEYQVAVKELMQSGDVVEVISPTWLVEGSGEWLFASIIFADSGKNGGGPHN